MDKYYFKLMTASIVCMTLCAPAWAQPMLTQADLAGLPKRTQNTLKRYEACLHFACEWSGEPARDQYVRQRVLELDCEHIERDIASLRRKAGAHSRTRRLIERLAYAYGECQNETTTTMPKG